MTKPSRMNNDLKKKTIHSLSDFLLAKISIEKMDMVDQAELSCYLEYRFRLYHSNPIF